MMDPTVKAALQSAARHISTAGGGGGMVAGGDLGPVLFGIATGQWIAGVVFVANLVLAVLDKLPERQA